MFPKALMAVLLLAGAARAQTYDVDGDGDIDSDDWESVPPPLVEADEGYAEAPPPQEPTQYTFEQQLSAYGTWYGEPGVGRVWQPAPSVVGYEFVPYSTGGSWVSTRYGWQFASSYPFGSAPFHYGRWYRSPQYGWVWWPSYTWGASWVDWRCNRSGNVAWTPMAPPGMRVSFSAGAPGWSFAFGRYHRPNVVSVPSHWNLRLGARGNRGGGWYAQPGRWDRGPGWQSPPGRWYGGRYHQATPAWGGGPSRGPGAPHRGRHRGR